MPKRLACYFRCCQIEKCLCWNSLLTQACAWLKVLFSRPFRNWLLLKKTILKLSAWCIVIIMYIIYPWSFVNLQCCSSKAPSTKRLTIHTMLSSMKILCRQTLTCSECWNHPKYHVVESSHCSLPGSASSQSHQKQIKEGTAAGNCSTTFKAWTGPQIHPN